MVEKPGPSVLLPNSSTIAVTSQGKLPLSPKLSSYACNTMVFSDLKSASLISINQLCDDNCNVLLNKKKLIVVKDDAIILQGVQNFTDGLWDIPVQK